MKIEKNAVAGTLESSDIYISVEPAETLTLEIDSVVSNQFYDEIERTLQEVLKEFEIESGKVSVKDRGALECVIRARMETAIKRGGAC